MRFRFLALLLSSLAACSNPYATPVVEEGLGFRGVKDYLASSPTVRMVLTHGMCSGSHLATGPLETNWVARRAMQIAAELGAPLDPQPRMRTYPPDARATGEPAVERYDYTFTGTRGTVEASFLIWGRHVDAYRKALEFENTSGDGSPGAPPVRAPVNAALKAELMNRCLIDAVVYLGRNGDPIRHQMRWALCDILGGRFAPASTAGAAETKAGCNAAQGFGDPAVLVPESLGSTILFDAFDDITPRAALAGIADIRSIFLASNQLVYLQQGNRPLGPPASGRVRARRAAAEGDALTGFLDLAAPTGFRARGLPGQPIELVAITDPNDPFGYRVNQAAVAGRNIALRNVLVSNAPTILGVFSDPIAAHRNTERPQVIELIVNGRP